MDMEIFQGMEAAELRKYMKVKGDVGSKTT